MAKAWLQKEENPDDDDSHLFNNCAVRSSAELGDANSTTIEHCTCEDKADPVSEKDRASLELLYGNEYIVSMIIDALLFVKGAWEQLGRNE